MAKIKKFDEGGDINFLKVFRKEDLEKKTDLLDVKKLEKQREVQQHGGRVYMGDPHTKPASKEELAAFEKGSIDEKPDYHKRIIGGYARAAERGLDAALPLRKFANMAIASTIANKSKKQYDDQVAAFESMPKEEQDRDRLRTRAVKPMKKGGMTASSRADGIAQRGKTKGRMC